MKKFKFLKRNKISRLPKAPGVYCFKKEKEILYIGKAVNIKERVKNHFPSRSEGERRSQKQVSSLVSPSARRTNVLRTPKRQRRGEKKIYLLRTQQPGYRDYLFLDKVKKIGFLQTDSEIEALILEANLIKKYQPKYNVVWRDDKNYFFVGITKEDFPRVFWTHQTKLKKPATSNKQQATSYVGPFVEGTALKKTLRILRRIFPYYTVKKHPRTHCPWCHLNLCPGPNPPKKEYQKNIKNLISVLRGERKSVLKEMGREMERVVQTQDFEKAAKIRDQISVLEKILAQAKIFIPGIAVESRPWQFVHDNWKEWEKELRKILLTKKKISKIEAYDVSNIQGQLATGAMVTFVKGKPEKNFYRRFKIKISGKPNDIAMIKEILSRRLNHSEWPYPDLILIDGGKAQLNAALKSLTSGVKPEVMAIAKKRNELYLKDKEPILLRNLPREIFNLILQLRDEAHRFAISYHKKLREKELFGY